MANNGQVLITPQFRMSYPNLVKPRRYEENGKAQGDPKFSTEMLIPTEDMGTFKKWNETNESFDDVDFARICAGLAKGAWPDINLKEAVVQGGLGWPISDGNTIADKKVSGGKKEDSVAAYRGMKLTRAKSNEDMPPRLYCYEDKKKRQLVRGMDADMEKAANLFKGGSYAYAEITVKAVEMAGRKYVTSYLNGVVFVKQGELLGAPSVMDRYDAGITGGESDYDPTDGLDNDLDDEIPF